MPDFRGQKKEYVDRLMRAARNERIRIALERAIASYRSNVEKALSRHPHTTQLAEEVRKIKEQSIERMDELVKEAMDSFADQGISASENPARRNKTRERAGSCEDDRRPVCRDHILPSAPSARPQTKPAPTSVKIRHIVPI